MIKKTFFQERKYDELLDMSLTNVENPQGLVDVIEELDSDKEGLVLDFPLVHPAFEKSGNPQVVSRKTLRGVKRVGNNRYYPSYLQLQQPRSKENAVAFFNKGNFPINLRNKAFFDSMKNVPEENNFNVGYMVWPVSGNDLSPIMVPFWSIAEGCMVDSYNSRICKGENGSKVERVYGPEVIVKVPSRHKKAQKYVIKFSNVPSKEFTDNQNAVIGWNTRPAYGKMVDENFVQDESFAPLHKLTNLSHEGSHRNGESFQFTMVYPHCVAAYQAILRQAMNNEKDFSSLEMSQYALLSREDASFYNKLRNNVLIREKNEEGDYVLRRPRLDQKSMLLARRVGNKVKKLEKGQIQETMFWDAERDGRIADYPFLVGER